MVATQKTIVFGLAQENAPFRKVKFPVRCYMIEIGDVEVLVFTISESIGASHVQLPFAGAIPLAFPGPRLSYLIFS